MSRVIVDWISVTLPLYSIVSPKEIGEKFDMSGECRDMFPYISDWLLSFSDIKVCGGNRIFDQGVRSKAGGFHIFWNDTKRFSLIEFSGKGVHELRKSQLLMPLISMHRTHLTRIDVACDWLTDITPRDFSEIREKNRFVSHAEINSDTGETCYVGSKESDRFCRVYRYAAPHPRHEYLRAEFVMRKNNAKMFGELLQTHKLRELFGQLLNTFGYSHPLALGEVAEAPMKSAPRATSQGKTERWLFKQVLPALKKLIDNGSHDTIDLFMETVYDYFNDSLLAEANKDVPQDLRTHVYLDSENTVQVHRTLPEYPHRRSDGLWGNRRSSEGSSSDGSV